MCSHLLQKQAASNRAEQLQPYKTRMAGNLQLASTRTTKPRATTRARSTPVPVRSQRTSLLRHRPSRVAAQTRARMHHAPSMLCVGFRSLTRQDEDARRNSCCACFPSPRSSSFHPPAGLGPFPSHPTTNHHSTQPCFDFDFLGQKNEIWKKKKWNQFVSRFLIQRMDGHLRRFVASSSSSSSCGWFVCRAQKSPTQANKQACHNVR